MRTFAGMCLVLLLVLFSGCRKKEYRTERPAQETGSRVASTDSVRADLKESAPEQSQKPEKGDRVDVLPRVKLPASVPEREVAVSLDNDGFKVGDMPLLIDNYTRTGKRGGGGISIYGDLRDAVLDFSALEKNQWIPVAVQNGEDYLAIICAEAPKIVVTSDGLVYPLGAKTMDSRGPFVRLKLYNSDRNKVDLKSLTIRVAQGSAVYEHWISDNLIVISGVSREQIVLSVSTGQEVLEFVIFPYVRGASPELVAYNVYNVNIGTLLPKGP